MAQEKTALLWHEGRWLEPRGTTPTSLDAFRWILDDVEDEAKIHHVGGLFRKVRRMNRIPAA